MGAVPILDELERTVWLRDPKMNPPISISEVKHGVYFWETNEKLNHPGYAFKNGPIRDNCRDRGLVGGHDNPGVWPGQIIGGHP